MATPQEHTSQEQHQLSEQQHPDLQNQEGYEQPHQDEEHNQDHHEYDGQDYEDNLDQQEAEAQDDRDENGQEIEEQENEDEGEYPEGNENHSQQQQQEQHDGALYGYENGQAQEQLEDEYKEAFQYNSQQQDEEDGEYQQGRPEEEELPSDVPQQQYAYLQQGNSAIQAQLPQTYQENGIEYEAVEQTVIEYQPVEKKITVMVPKKKAVSSTDLQNTLVHSQIRTVPVAGIFSPPPFLASSQIKLNSVVQPQQVRAGNVLFQSQIIRSVPSFQQVNFQQPRLTPTTTFVQPPSAQIAVSRVITQPFNLPRPNVASVQPYFVRQQIPQQQQFQTQIIRQAQPIVQLQQPQQVQIKQISAQSQGFSQPTQVFRPPFAIAKSPSVLQPPFVNSSQVIQTPLLQSRIVRQPFSTNIISTPTLTANPFFQSRQIILPSSQAQWQQFPTPKFQQSAQVPKPQETKVTSAETGKK